MKNPICNNVAIIGMACFFPKSSGIKEYWRLLFRGEDAVEQVPESHWRPEDYFDADPKTPDHVYCVRGGYLKPVPFDPTEFGIPPSTLEATDSSQILGLVAAKMALEDAGYGPGTGYDHQRTSVVLGVTGTQELVIPLGARLGHPIWRKALNEAGIDPETADKIVQSISEGYVSWQENSFPGLLGNVVAGRICNRLNLRGTNCVVDAACASSFGALHTALMELISGRSEMVISGGVDTLNDIFMHMCFAKTQILSPTQDARPFSSTADGTVLGEGIGMVVLKRLEDAQRDGDRIYAVIRGMGASSDGKASSIYAPRSEGQVRALKSAYQLAQINPDTVELVEAHGTGTRVGDVTEFEGLKQVFDDETLKTGDTSIQRTGKCALGSVKSMIGHTKAAAGAAGLIKATLALYHKVFPPTLKIDTPDPRLNIEQSPFYLSTETRPWFSRPEHPRRAGVSAFGFGGSNFHAVLEEYQPEKAEVAWDGSVEIFAFSGADRNDIIQQMRSVSEKLSQVDFHHGNGMKQLAAIASKTRATFSGSHAQRVTVVYPVDEEIAPDTVITGAIDQFSSGDETTKSGSRDVFMGSGSPPGKIAFVFPGQGSQYPGMGRDLVCCFPDAFGVVEMANGYPIGGVRISDVIYPYPVMSKTQRQEQESLLKQTDMAQPAIGAISVAMYRILNYFGIHPDATAGHSYGELPALFAGGAMDMDTLFRLSVARGRCMADAGKQSGNGTMLAVKAPLEVLESILEESREPDLVLANRNAPDQGVFSGSTEAIERIAAFCKEKGYQIFRLSVSAAFHSQLMKDAVAPFQRVIEKVTLKPPKIPVYSNTTANPYPESETERKRLLSNHILKPVEFVQMIRNMFLWGVRTFVEVGPKSVMSRLVASILEGSEFAAMAMDASSGKQFGLLDLARLLGNLAVMGYPVELNKWEDSQVDVPAQRMAIPIVGANYRSEKTIPNPIAKKTRHDNSVNKLRGKSGNKKGSGNPDTPKLRENSALGQLPPAIANEKRSHPSVLPGQASANPDSGTQQPCSHNACAPNQNRTIPASGHTHGVAKSPFSNNPIRNWQNKMKGNRKPEHTSFIAEALKAVQEGLKSMQSLQMQTAETHKKFLDTQAEATRTLRAMMESTGRMAGISLQESIPVSEDLYAKSQIEQPVRQMEMPSEPAYGTDAAVQIDPGPEPVAKQSNPAPIPETPLSRPPVPQVPMLPKKDLPEKTEQVAQATEPPMAVNAIETALLEVVSELTGYPEEMISMDMDIEADLGIDSIKRVEILSAMEEKLPHLPQVSPEVMGTLKTLGQICQYLSDGMPSATQPPDTAAQIPDQARPAEKRSDTEADRKLIEQTIGEVVAELTGYPAEMLRMDMDIEADLGIDSIKRVEILSAMEEKIPHMPPISPEIMGTLKTLGQIADYLVGQSGQSDIQAPEPEVADHGDIEKNLIEIVAELTGYPPEMLSMDMDVEADLGIDSIKRVEILSAMEERMPQLPPVSPEIMGTLNTLGQIVQYLAGRNADPDGAGAVSPEAPPSEETSPASNAGPEPEADIPVERRVVRLVSAEPDPSQQRRISVAGKVWVVNDGTDLATAVVDAFKSRNIQAGLIDAGKFPDASQISDTAGAVILAGPNQFSSEWDHDFLKYGFKLARLLGTELNRSDHQGRSFFGTVTRLDGGFGFRGMDLKRPIQGGLAGLTKTAALEWPGVNCRAIDVDPEWTDTKAMATAIVAELLTAGPREVGLGPESRWVPELYPESCPLGDLQLATGDVVIVTGGARGVTAESVVALAKEVQPTLVIFGRSPLPEEEPDWLAEISGDANIKRAILEHHFQGKTPTPVELESVYQKLMAAREIQHNLDRMAYVGADIFYKAVDVRDFQKVNSAIEDIRTGVGPIKAIIHGAGTIDDRLILEKTDDQFDRVFDTKVIGLENLLRATQPDPLAYLILFSSVSARMGNQGQVDYAMANEVLNKIAQHHVRQRRNCRVVSINWGPWDGGMVDDSLRREFHRRGVGLISMASGAKQMVAEMKALNQEAVEVVIGSGFETLPDQPPATEPQVTNLVTQPEPTHPDQEELSLTLKRDLDLDQYPILQAHMLDGNPVVPLALMTEWLGHGALHNNPGLYLHGLDNIRVLNGIKLNESRKPIRLMAGKAKKRGFFYEVDVEIRNGFHNETDLIHSRAKAILTDKLANPPVFNPSPFITHKPYHRTIDEVYDKILFHGDALRGIQEIVSYSPKAIVARIANAPSPDQWMTEPIRSRWLGDPLVLDSAFQMAIIWCYEERGVVSLPIYTASYRQYCESFPEEGVTAVLEVVEATKHKMVGNFTFLNARNQVVATLTGYEAVMDASLLKAFKPAA